MRKSENIHILIFFIGLLLTFSCKKNAIEVIRYDANINDYSPIVSKILSRYPDGNVTLKFGKGIYEFYPEKASEDFLNISNNDSGNKKIAFFIKGMKNVRIEGHDSNFLFHGSIIPTAILCSENVTIKGISIDYDYAWTFEGKVIDNNEVSRSFTVKVLPGNKYRISDGHLLFSGYDWEFPMGECFIFDPKTRRPIYDTFSYFHGYWAGDMQAEDLGNGLVRFSGHNGRLLPPVGSIWDDKGPTGQNRKYPGIAILRSANVIIENVRVYRSGAMSLISEYSKDIIVRGFSSERHENSERMVTSSADATHFVNCKGKIILENCRFESMLDDATNIHGVYMLADSILSPTKISVVFGHFQQEGNWFAEEGDTMRFIDKRTMRPVGEGKLINIDRPSRKQYIIETDFKITDTKIPYAIENISCNASVEIRNCTVQYNRARSFLISTAGDVLIEDCTLKQMMAGINISGDANFWYESGCTKNITIRNNYFENIAIGGNEPQCALQIDPMIKKDSRQNDFYYHGNVIFEGNRIATFDNQIIYARSIKSLKIKNNTFIKTDDFKAFYPDLAAIDIQFCNDLEISGNDFSLWSNKAMMSLHECQNISNDTKLSIIDKPNRFFERY